MTSNGIKATLLLLISCATFSRCAQADTVDATTPLPTALPISATLSGGVATTSNSPYADLQEAWDNCFDIKNTCADLLDEGRFAPARKKWVDYDVSMIQQSLDNLKNAYDGTHLPGDVAGGTNAAWTAAGGAIDAMQKNLQQLQSVDAGLKSPTDDAYPAKFWSPTRDIMNGAVDLDKSLVTVLGALEGASPPQVASGKLQGGVQIAGKADVDGLATAIKKISDATQHMASELDRFNLSWGKAPTQPLQNEFYQGAFTKQEILSQYKYMPSFVFTTDPSVARFTYRLPPRKNVLALYTNQIGKLLNLMDSDMLNLQSAINSTTDQSLTAPWQEMEKKYIDARAQYMALYNLINSTTDADLAKDIRGDQSTFGKPMVALRNDIDQFKSAMNDFLALAR
jgi:hypothetical protein